MQITDPFGVVYEDSLAHITSSEGRVFQVLTPDGDVDLEATARAAQQAAEAEP